MKRRMINSGEEMKNEKGRIRNRERKEMGSREEGMGELGRRWNNE